MDKPTADFEHESTILEQLSEGLDLDVVDFERHWDTPEFKKWFGKSHVVDEQGLPERVYHGTPNGHFNAFDIDKAGSNLDSGWLGHGIYLTNDHLVSAHYSDSGHGKTPATYPLYLSMKNPYYWGDKTKGVRDIIYGGKLPDEDLHKAVVKRANFEYEPGEDPDFNQEHTLSNALREELISRGHDGVIANVETEDPYRPDFKEYVAFHPHQLKSAIANKGDYSSEDPNMNFSADFSQKTTDKRISSLKKEFADLDTATELRRDLIRELRIASEQALIETFGSDAPKDAKSLVRDFLRFQRTCAYNYAAEAKDNGVLASRTQMYASALHGLYQSLKRLKAEKSGAKWERRVLGPAEESCSTCKKLAGKWAKLGSLPKIGDSPCKANCRCRFEFRNSEEKPS